MNREDELFIAKKTAERAGYKVLRQDREERLRFPRGYVYKPERREERIVQKTDPVAKAMKIAVDNGITVTKKDSREREKPKQTTPAFVNKAVDFLQKDE